MTTVAEDERYERPRYCTSCGRRLVPVTSISRYDEYTGEPQTDDWLQCPTGQLTHSRKNAHWSRLKPEYQKP